MGWLDGISISGVIQGVSAVAAAVSAIAACAAAMATYRSVSQPAREREREAKAIATATLDGFVGDLVLMRRAFNVRSVIVYALHAAYKDGKQSEVVAAVNAMSASIGRASIPRLRPSSDNLEIVIALNRLRTSLNEWESTTKTFTFDLHSFFYDRDDLGIRELDRLKDLYDRVIRDMINLGEEVSLLFPGRKEELSSVVSKSKGIVLQKSPF